ncbi:PREDICTED: uncharacterized protein LOC108365450 [Rhagoletis zephyria]|uniref:uncharacterized protein LOC108365450 n=1 Tax=Rhagoletis zephyria TaxID=28612 RepID=UPI0008115712|nr:PREDICTED: uncharacterized protein LOC108365450 [Rhagoletis zephyria]
MPDKVIKALNAVLVTQKLSIDRISNTFDAKFKDLSKQFDAIKDLIISLHPTNNNSSANNLNAVNADMMAAEFNARKTAANKTRPNSSTSNLLTSYNNNYFCSSPGVFEFSAVPHPFNSPRAQFVSNVNGISAARLDSAVTIATAVNTLVTNDSTYTSVKRSAKLSRSPVRKQLRSAGLLPTEQQQKVREIQAHNGFKEGENERMMERREDALTLLGEKIRELINMIEAQSRVNIPMKDVTSTSPKELIGRTLQQQPLQIINEGITKTHGSAPPTDQSAATGPASSQSEEQ